MPSSQEINKLVRESLGLPAKQESQPTVPVEGHVCDFPLWSYSKRRSSVTRLHIDYDDGSFFTLEALKGMPSVSSPGYLDVLLYFGQHDLFTQNYVEISVYRVLQHLGKDPHHSNSYRDFIRDMERNFALMIKTDRLIDPVTRERNYTTYFRIFDTMKIAKRGNGASRFYFNTIFLDSLRSGYLKRLDFDFCLHLDRNTDALARFLYAHLLKRIGEKSVYTRRMTGFLQDIGLGHLAMLESWRRNERLKREVFPALELIKGHAFSHYALEGGNIFFLHP